MKPSFSTKPVWFDPSAKIAALKGKTIMLKYSEEEHPAHVRIERSSQADGKLAVQVWRYLTAVGPVPSRTFEQHQWSQYLTEAALESLRPNTQPSPETDFVLEVQGEAERSDHQ